MNFWDLNVNSKSNLSETSMVGLVIECADFVSFTGFRDVRPTGDFWVQFRIFIEKLVFSYGINSCNL